MNGCDILCGISKGTFEYYFDIIHRWKFKSSWN